MINLLPPQYREELRLEENFKLVLILGMIFLIFLFSLVLILFSVKVHIQGKTEALKVLLKAEEARLQIAEIQDIQRKIATSNEMILELQSFYEVKTDSINILEKIFQTLPSGVYLTSLSWQKEAGQVAVFGFAPKRELLFELKNNLETKAEFSDIDFPPQNWIKPADIDFQAFFKIRK